MSLFENPPFLHLPFNLSIQLRIRVRINYCTSIRQVFYFEEYDTSNLLLECRFSSRGQLHSEWQLPHRLSILLLSFHFHFFVTSALSSCILGLVLTSSWIADFTLLYKFTRIFSAAHLASQYSYYFN